MPLGLGLGIARGFRPNGAVAPSVVQPTDFGTDLAALYKSDSLGTPADGTNVTSWTDSSGNGLTLSSFGTAPKFYANFINGYPEVRFISGALARSFTLNQPCEVWIVYSGIVGLSGSADGNCDGATLVSGAIATSKNASTQSPTIICNAGTGISRTDFTQADGYPEIVRMKLNGASSLLRCNKWDALSGNAGSSNPAGFVLGSLAGVARPSKMSVAEVVIIKRALTNTERDGLEQYFINKYMPLGLLMMTGNSICRGYGLTDNALAKQISGLYSNKYVIRNFGTDSITQVTINSRYSGLEATVYQAYYAKRFGYIHEITNHLATTSDVSLTISTLKTFVQSLISTGFTPLIGNCLPRSNAGTPANFNSTLMPAANAALAADSLMAPYIVDYQGNATIGPAGAETNATYYQDLCHPTAAGYTIMAGILKAKMDTF